MTDLDVADTARLLGVTERTVRRWLREGRLSAYRVGGRIRIPASAVREAQAPYGSKESQDVSAVDDWDRVGRFLADPARLQSRREAAALSIDAIAAMSHPPTSDDDTAEALIRSVRAEQAGKWMEQGGRDRS